MNFYKIVSDGVPIPLTYSSHQLLKLGDIVIITIRQRELLGVIFAQDKDETNFNIKPITRITGINVGENLINFIMKFSEHTLYPSYIFLKSIIPKFYGRNQLKEKNNYSWEPYSIKKPLIFNEEQTLAVQTINQCQGYKTFLLYGTTGSGKTEVSIGAIINVIQQGKQVLILLPEISLINQWVQRIQSYVDCPIIIYHYLQGKTKTNWESILYKKGIVVVGARSAIFLPFQNLGLIIVDEEHDTSYKQETKQTGVSMPGAFA
jgi:primosomal protein N' (replication factor Y)